MLQQLACLRQRKTPLTSKAKVKKQLKLQQRQPDTLADNRFKTHNFSETTECPRGLSRRAASAPASSRSRRFRAAHQHSHPSQGFIHSRRGILQVLSPTVPVVPPHVLIAMSGSLCLRFSHRPQGLGLVPCLFPQTCGTAFPTPLPRCLYRWRGRLRPTPRPRAVAAVCCLPALVVSMKVAQHTFFTSSMCQFFHPFTNRSLWKVCLVELVSTTWSDTVCFSKSPVFTASWVSTFMNLPNPAILFNLLR